MNLSIIQNKKSEREATGIGDQYSTLQPTSMPNIDIDLIGKRLDIFELYALEEGGTELHWSQGKVVAVSDGKKYYQARVKNSMFKKRRRCFNLLGCK